MAMTLAELGHDVIGIDTSEDNVRVLADHISLSMQLDATDEKALRAAGIQDVDVAVVSIGEHIESSLMVVTLLREMGIKEIVAKAVTPLHGRILEKLGVARVVFPEREMAVRVAHSLVVANVLDYIELSDKFSIAEIPAPAEFAGKTLREIGLRSRFGLTTIAIKRAPPNRATATSPTLRRVPTMWSRRATCWRCLGATSGSANWTSSSRRPRNPDTPFVTPFALRKPGPR